MKLIYFFVLLLLLPAFTLLAQSETLFNQTQVSLSPSEDRYDSFLFDNDAIRQRQLYANPAFYELLYRNNNLFSAAKHKSILTAGYSNGELDGDFLPFEGNSFNDYRIMGSGEYSIASTGTLFGSVQYAKGKHKNIGWNAVRNSELYHPYISTDSIGGDFNYDDYRVSAGYSFKLRDLYLGVYGAFHGEQAYRISDPRALNNSTWLDLGAGAGKVINNHLFMIRAGFGRHKQHLTMRYWRPGQQDRFFVTYGFGLYDIRHSKVSFGYSRMYYVNRKNAAFTYQSPTGSPLSLYVALEYLHDYMKTEESDIRDLYYSRSHQLKPTIRLDMKTNRSFVFSLFFQGTMNNRKGYENIFEQYLIDEANNIYDFRLIDTQQQYLSDGSEALGELNISFLHPVCTIKLKGGTSYSIHEEKYKSEGYKIENSALFPYIGAGFHALRKSSELTLSALWIKKMPYAGVYNVEIDSKSIDHLDFQHAFSPYAYYESKFSSLNLSATYVYHLNKYGIGINLKLMYKRGERQKDAVYEGKVGFDSSAPGINTTPDAHNETWWSSSLFVLF